MAAACTARLMDGGMMRHGPMGRGPDGAPPPPPPQQ